MPALRFLVTGATATTGGAAAAQLLDKGRTVRAFVHREDEWSEALARRGAEIVVGELLDFDAVRSALEDVERAYFVYPIRPGLVQATAQFAQGITGRPGSECVVQHLREVAIDHTNGVFAGTNDLVGRRPCLTAPRNRIRAKGIGIRSTR